MSSTTQPDDRQGIPAELSKGQVAAGLRAMGIPPDDVTCVVLDAAEDKVIVTVYARGESGRWYVGDGVPATKELEVKLT